VQTFSAAVTEAIDPDKLKRSWESEPEHDHWPRVKFDVEGETVSVIIFSNPRTPWAEASFKQMFSIAVHRIAPTCQIEWIA
jgi:hypothetical protein